MPTAFADLVLGVAVIGLLTPHVDWAPLRWITGVVRLSLQAEPVTPHECIVEQRASFRGVEIVSRVNYSQLARVNRSRGLRFDLAVRSRRSSDILSGTFRPTPAFVRALAAIEPQSVKRAA